LDEFSQADAKARSDAGALAKLDTPHLGIAAHTARLGALKESRTIIILTSFAQNDALSS
jgi:hypothetical protein